MRRLSLPGFLALLVAACLAWVGPAEAQNGKVTLLHFNDVYEITPVRGKGGLAELMTLLRQERARDPKAITVVAGDFLSPSILSGLTKGAQMIDLFNVIGVDLVTFGNHEFDFGPENAQVRVADSKFTWLGTNVLGADGKPFAGSASTVVREVGDVKVGFFGLTIPDTVKLSSPGPGITFASPVETARAAVADLKKQGAAVIVAVTHLDYADDRALARAVPGIDVILGGHDHDAITFYERGSLVHKSGSDAQFLGVIELDVKTAKGPTGASITTVTPQWRMLANTGIAPDAQVAPVVKTYTDRLDAELGVVIGKTEVELDSRVDTVRSGEARIGNLIADAIRERLGADVAVTNGGGIRANRVLAAGSSITRKDMLAELPFGNLAILVDIAGADLQAGLENGLSQVEGKAGRFPQVSGLTIEYDPKATAGARITKLLVGGKPIDPAGRYKLATSDYLAGGGDGYAPFAKAKPVTDAHFAMLMATMVMEYVAAKGTVAPALEGRVLARP